MMKRGDIYWADIVPRFGSEQTGRLPVVVISHDAFNQVPSWKSIIVVPLSTSPSQARRGPSVVELSAPLTGGRGQRCHVSPGDHVGSCEAAQQDRFTCPRRP